MHYMTAPCLSWPATCALDTGRTSPRMIIVLLKHLQTCLQRTIQRDLTKIASKMQCMKHTVEEMKKAVVLKEL